MSKRKGKKSFNKKRKTLRLGGKSKAPMKYFQGGGRY